MEMWSVCRPQAEALVVERGQSAFLPLSALKVGFWPMPVMRHRTDSPKILGFVANPGFVEFAAEISVARQTCPVAGIDSISCDYLRRMSRASAKMSFSIELQ